MIQDTSGENGRGIGSALVMDIGNRADAVAVIKGSDSTPENKVASQAVLDVMRDQDSSEVVEGLQATEAGKAILSGLGGSSIEGTYPPHTSGTAEAPTAPVEAPTPIPVVQ